MIRAVQLGRVVLVFQVALVFPVVLVVRVFQVGRVVLLGPGRDQRDSLFSRILEDFFSFSLFFLEKKRMKSGAGYNFTSIFVPNCISKDCQISSKHQPQNIGQISVLKS